MNKQIEPCPNPGCADDKLSGRVMVASFPPPFRAVFCPVCQMRGPGRRTDAEAIEAWNPIARAVREAAELRNEAGRLKRDLTFVERWACHHAPKRRESGELVHSAEEILSVIQHHPAIKKITKSYADGVVPDTPNPFDRAEKAEAQREVLRALIREAFVTMRHAQTFIESREKMHPTGRDLYADLLERLCVAKKGSP